MISAVQQNTEYKLSNCWVPHRQTHNPVVEHNRPKVMCAFVQSTLWVSVESNWLQFRRSWQPMPSISVLWTWLGHLPAVFIISYVGNYGCRWYLCHCVHGQFKCMNCDRMQVVSMTLFILWPVSNVEECLTVRNRPGNIFFITISRNHPHGTGYSNRISSPGSILDHHCSIQIPSVDPAKP